MVIQTDKISLTLNGAESMKKLGVPVPNATEGSISKSVLDITKDCAVQRESGKSIVYTEAEARQLNETKVELPQDIGMSPADFISRCMTGEDAQALSDEGTPLEEYTSSQLERAVSRVKEQRSDNRRAVEAQVSKEHNKQEALEDTALENMVEAQISANAVKQLQQSDLPVTPENVARLSHAVEMTAELSAFSEASMKFFIGNELAVTPENINGSVYGAERNAAETGGASKPADAGMADDFSAVAGQAADILAADGMEATAEAMETAEWLYENDLPVTAQNIRNYQTIEELKDLEPEVITERIVDAMADGMQPEKANLGKLSFSEAESAVQTLTSTEERTLRKAYPAEADFVRAKRQLEEIRLTMTAEAARKMSAKGINLDITNLQKIVEELRIQERQAEEALLSETELAVTKENAELLTGTLLAAENVLAAPIELLGASRPALYDGTLSELSESAVEMRAGYEQMERTYEAVGTEVRRDLGDSMNKAFQNVGDILREMDMEDTAMNRRAVRILGYNQMEITRESVNDMKACDSRVTALMESLKPPVVAELIKRGINPLENSLDELYAEVEQVQGELVAEDIPLRKYLWKMDRLGELSEEERESMIGVYRLLDKIEKSDGAVVGQVVKEGRELSLSSLLSAVRTRRNGGVDVQVDDNFGGLEETVSKGVSISEQIQAAYGKSVISKLQRELSPKVLRDRTGDFSDMSLETLLELCRTEGETDGEMADYYRQMASDIRAGMADADERINEFLRALELPDTLTNLAAAQAWLGSGGREYRSLWKREESERLAESFDEPEELDMLCGEIDEAHTKELEKKKESDDISYGGILSLAKMAGSISFYRNLRSCQMYEVPVVTEQGVTTCNVTIQDGAGRDKGTVEISLESEELGAVQATFRVSGKQIRGFVTAERPESLEKCRRILDGFEKDLEENGFTMDGNSLVQGNRNSLHVGNKSDGAKNRDLYRVAKLFIVNIKRKDEAYED